MRKGKLVKHPQEQAALTEMRVMRAQGASLRAISAALADEGYALSRMGVSRALQDG